MPKKTIIIWFFMILLVLGGITLMFAVDLWSGFYLVVMGLFLAALIVFDIRQVKKAVQNVCPQCGQMIVEGSKFCTNCESETG